MVDRENKMNNEKDMISTSGSDKDKRYMKPEKEVTDYINAIYRGTYKGGLDKFNLRQLFENGYRILNERNGRAGFLPANLIDQYASANLRNSVNALTEIKRILERLM
jgi:hypothetical protein